MNNEELENSLRTEVDNYFKSAFADMRQEIEKLQTALDAEVERHRTQIEEQFKQLLERDIQNIKIDDSFASLVAEHLRIAREEGANAVTEALALAEENREPEPQVVAAEISYTDIRDAVNDISVQPSQAEILKTLVRYAGNFAPRGALFIVKSDHLIGWRVFGEEAGNAEEAIREVFLPLAKDSLLSASIKYQSIQNAADSPHSYDTQFLQKLGFGQSDNAAAIPLIVRGRGVAALYVDGGENNKQVHADALESLVRVASLTVELLAAAKSAPATAPAAPRQQPLSSFTERPKPQHAREPERVASASPVRETAQVVESRNGSYSYQRDEEAIEAEVVREETHAEQPSVVNPVNTYETFSFAEPEPTTFTQPAPTVIEQPQTSRSSYDSFVTDSQTAQPSFETASPIVDYSTSFASPQPEVVEAPQPVETAATPPAARRFGDRNLDLPIDVPEEERRLHNDARRFARLLVSEIKLYNEQKVKEGRQSADLYDRLREAIDRSREMYDKRVSPPVAAKFDYFNFELVNTLAEGDASKLGSDYPGATS
ncbi:MAG TPA: hypothetical protein VEX64_11040 [Pyrinomonadaceae bacterium]|nr:hypothetical protein [Pyrinomonadaceae bacterium]